MKNKFSVLVSVFLILGLFMVVGVCNAEDSSGTLRIANPTDIKKLDPVDIQDATSSRVADLVFDHLATYDYDGE
ncbi:hypothetical protein KGY79_11235, partial [Candidatus Bipolaricaulota bacterium]|nr:hypothetical protein [Candidatus Bipolaricaulota bacterium]